VALSVDRSEGERETAGLEGEGLVVLFGVVVEGGE